MKATTTTRTTVTLGLCLSYYNDINCLKRFLKSIGILPQKYKQNVILIAIDGKYRGYDEIVSSKSTDGSYELIEHQAKKILDRVVNTATPTALVEREKRQKYVDIAAMLGCDCIIIIDSDEWFGVIHWNQLFEELEHIKEYEVGNGNVFKIHCVDMGNDQPQFRKRLWFHPESMRYGDRHWKFNVRGIVRPIPSDIIQIYHDSSECRSDWRLQQQQDYESRLQSLESSG